MRQYHTYLVVWAFLVVAVYCWKAAIEERWQAILPDVALALLFGTLGWCLLWLP